MPYEYKVKAIDVLQSIGAYTESKLELKKTGGESIGGALQYTNSTDTPVLTHSLFEIPDDITLDDIISATIETTAKGVLIPPEDPEGFSVSIVSATYKNGVVLGGPPDTIPGAITALNDDNEATSIGGGGEAYDGVLIGLTSAGFALSGIPEGYGVKSFGFDISGSIYKDPRGPETIGFVSYISGISPAVTPTNEQKVLSGGGGSSSVSSSFGPYTKADGGVWDIGSIGATLGISGGGSFIPPQAFYECRAFIYSIRCNVMLAPLDGEDPEDQYGTPIVYSMSACITVKPEPTDDTPDPPGP